MTVDRFVEDRRAGRLALGILLVPLVVTFLLGVATPDIAANALDPETREHLAQRRLWTDIPDQYRPIVGPLIIVNNVRVAVVAFAGGLTAGVLTLYVLIGNGALLGTIFAVVQGYGMTGGLLAFTAAPSPAGRFADVVSGRPGRRLPLAPLPPPAPRRRC